jgi:Tfp pilus assembly ATPase PilU
LEYDPSNEEHKELMEYLVSEGAATLDGIADDGEPVYKFDMEILEEVMPELHQAMLNDMDQVLLNLYQKGLIEVSYDEDLNAQIAVSEEGRNALIQAGFDMDSFDEGIY